VRALVLALLVAACGGGGKPAGGKVIPEGPMSLVLPAADGGEIDLAAYRGKTVVLHVFTTWSLGATADVAQLTAVKDPFVAVIGIALDLEGYAVVKPWRAALGVRYLVALADDDFRAGNSRLGRVAEVPTTIVLDPAGAITHWIARPLGDGELAAVLSSRP
jgi:hypothetical protein